MDSLKIKTTNFRLDRKSVSESAPSCEYINTTFKISKELQKKMKIHCAVNGMTKNDFLKTAIEKMLEGTDG